MDKVNMWDTLGIEETKDEDSIKAAYRKELVKVNPEDDPEGFKQLRQAYEMAIEAAKTTDLEKSGNILEKDEVDYWIDEVEKVYNHISQRIDAKAWEDILESDVCTDLDSEEETREKLLVFLMANCNIPHVVWERLDKHFGFTRDREKLYEKFPKNFIDFVVNQAKFDDFIDYELFEGPENGAYDEIINSIFVLKDMYDSQEGLEEGNRKTKDIYRKIEETQKLDVSHPYIKIVYMLTLLLDGKREAATDVMQEIENGEDAFSGRKYMNNIYVAYSVSKVVAANGDIERAFNIRQHILEKFPGHRMALLDDIRYYYEKGDYLKAKDKSIDFLDEFGNLPVALEYMRNSNARLMEEYKKKANEGDVESRYSLGWCYFQNEKYDECIKLMDACVPEKDSEFEFEYMNLTGRCLLGMEKYKKALRRLLRWKDILYSLEDDGSEKYKKRMRRKGYSNYVIGMCYFSLSQDEKKDEKAHQEFELAVSYLKEAIAGEDQAKEIIYYRDRLAFIYLKSKCYSECVNVCTELINEIPQYYMAYVMRQEAFFKMDYPQNAIDDYYAALNYYDKDTRTYELAAKTFLRYERYEDINEVFKKARQNGVWGQELDLIEIRRDWKMSEEDEKANATKSECLRRLYLMEDKYIVHHEESDIEDKAEITYLIASILLDMRRRTDAFKYLQKTVDINKERELAVNWLIADEYDSTGEYEKELSTLEKMSKKSDDLEIEFRKGICYWFLDENDKAKACYDHVFQTMPQHYAINAYLADYYSYIYRENHRIANYEQAIVHADKQCVINPSPSNFYKRGRIYFDRYDFENAIKDFERTLTDAPDYFDAKYYLARIEFIKGRADKCLSMIKEALADNMIQHFVGVKQCYGTLVEVCLALRKYKDAVRYAKTGSKLCNSNEWLIDELDEIYERTLQFQERMELHEGRIETAEDDSDRCGVYICIAQTYFAEGNDTKGNKAFKMAIKYAGKNRYDLQRVYASMSEIYGEDYGDFKKGLKYKLLQMSYADEKQTVRILLQLSWYYGECGNKKKALEFYEYFRIKCEQYYGSVKEYFMYMPDARSNFYLLGMFYKATGDKENLRKCITRVNEIKICSFCSYCGCYEQMILEAGLCELEKNYKAALTLYEKADKATNGSIQTHNLIEKTKKKIKH